MTATYAESAEVTMLVEASTQKMGDQVVITSSKWVDPQARIKRANPTKKITPVAHLNATGATN